MKIKTPHSAKQTIIFFAFVLTTLLFQSALYAQCIVGNTIGKNDPENDFFWGQSFTANCDGQLNYIEFITGEGGGTQTATTLRIFEGETVLGTPLYSQVVPEMTFSGSGENLRIYLDQVLPIVSDQKYTFELQVSVNLQISTANPYSGGIAFENGSGFSQVDFVFNVSI
ncbi:hypothetical protein JYT97_01880 [Haliea sp. AH-315-K21]|uniref:Uncharacterized protein n=1 Tax=SAR86 cluster bacterium TaxID=2030880 RepID=A0A2A5CCW7_9GAMM|nr:hypothetical protein [Haliea sp. AH-315-K21]MBN4075986.1 hypothetical protein [Gammaproteobacteria bacterium AH-315-E17]PCJ41216.1 MAG: hypothetical protein COA71_09265 [SAR86 cluster bacterium]